MLRLVSSVDPTSVFLRRLRRSRFRAAGIVRLLSRLAVFAVFAFVASAVLRIAATNHVRVVVAGEVYRSAQMTPENLEEFIHDRHIRTVVNLRGYCPDFDWYRNECEVTHRTDVSQEDVTLSAIRLPSPTEIRRLVEIVERSERPILLHCRQGIDRTGLASVVVLLLRPDVELGDACGQLSGWYGYVPYNGTENMRRFVRLYCEWLERLEVAHRPELFRQWAMKEYCPGPCRARVQLLDAPATRWPAQRARVLRLRATNESVETWRFRPGTRQGVHARYRVTDAGGTAIIEERAGLFDAVVASGESIDLHLGVPALEPGRYVLHVDLVDADDNAFSQFGFDPLSVEFDVGRP